MGDIRRAGLLAGIELVADKENKTAFAKELKVGQLLEDNAKDEGLVVRNIRDTIGICPPYIISEEELDLIVPRLKTALDKTYHSITT